MPVARATGGLLEYPMKAGQTIPKPIPVSPQVAILNYRKLTDELVMLATRKIHGIPNFRSRGNVQNRYLFHSSAKTPAVTAILRHPLILPTVVPRLCLTATFGNMCGFPAKLHNVNGLDMFAVRQRLFALLDSGSRNVVEARKFFRAIQRDEPVVIKIEPRQAGIGIVFRRRRFAGCDSAYGKRSVSAEPFVTPVREASRRHASDILSNKNPLLQRRMHAPVAINHLCDGKVDADRHQRNRFVFGELLR